MNSKMSISLMRERLAKDMAAEIVLSKSPEKVMRKWRNIFEISQKRLAEELRITPSVVSDYESGRRKSPGISIIRRYIDTLLEIDLRRGGVVITTFGKLQMAGNTDSAILDIREFSKGITLADFSRHISAEIISGQQDAPKEIYGYTLVDAPRAIMEFSFYELIKLYGKTSQRAIIFTKVSTGKSPMVAIKITNLKPAFVVLHGLDTVDEVARRIAEVERIPLAICRLHGVGDVVARLKKIEF